MSKALLFSWRKNWSSFYDRPLQQCVKCHVYWCIHILQGCWRKRQSQISLMNVIFWIRILHRNSITADRADSGLTGIPITRSDSVKISRNIRQTTMISTTLPLMRKVCRWEIYTYELHKYVLALRKKHMNSIVLIFYCPYLISYPAYCSHL